METVKTGFILYTINYDECVSFYKDVLALPVLYKKDELTCFEFFGSYIMVEVDDETDLTSPEIPARDRTCVRLNVTDVKLPVKNWMSKISPTPTLKTLGERLRNSEIRTETLLGFVLRKNTKQIQQ
jgi:extradiol dioxygenase family protein